MENKALPAYVKYPIFQIAYILLWIPIGIVISYILSFLIMAAVSTLMTGILETIFKIRFEIYMTSGTLETMINPFCFMVAVAFDLILLSAGLELIIAFLNKKRN